MRIAVVHDHLGWPGGGERTALIMALELKADFITCYKDAATYADYQQALGDRLIVLTAGRLDLKVARFFWQRYLFFKSRKLLAGYDILIASGHIATEAVAAYGRAGGTKILYNHTPPRRVYDLYRSSRQAYNFFLRPFYSLFAWGWRLAYEKAVDRYDYVIANSENIRRRLKDFTGRLTHQVIWPPIETGRFTWQGQADYYLSWGRVDESKRIGLIVEAFKRLPEERLIVASGGPLLEAIRAQAAGYDNIRVVGWVDDRTLAGLVGRCRAALYLPLDEDAGMTHLEANAAGKPVIGVDEGGLPETIIDGQTGLLLPADPGVEALVRAVGQADAAWCLERKEACIAHAKRYSRESFAKKLKAAVEAQRPDRPLLGLDASRWSDPAAWQDGIATGVEVYSRQLLPALAEAALAAGLRVRLYAPGIIPNLPLEWQKVLPGRRCWTRRILARELRRNPADYFFTPAYYIPRNAPRRSIATIHDVIFKTHPQKYSWTERLKQGYAARQNVKRAQAIITVSAASQQDIMRHYDLAPGRVAVIEPGIDLAKLPFSAGPRTKTILYLGRVESKKSVRLLVEAFARFAASRPDWRLVLAGKPGFGYGEITQAISELGLNGRVDLPGYVSEAAKAELLSRAGILVHPSANEGFCFPLLEAWASGLPAIVSDTPLMAALAGQAALLFRAGQADALARAVEKMATDQALAQSLVEKGRERVKQHSWPQAAQKILGLILKEKP